MKLRASRPVLIGCTQYGAGDQLPVTNEALVGAWLEAGSAVWVDEDEERAAAETPKAKTIALAGLPGKSSDGDPDAMVGKVPARRPAAKKAPTKTPAKTTRSKK